MKKKTTTLPLHENSEAAVLPDAAPMPVERVDSGRAEPPMIRTQIYLSPTEHEFLRAEAARRAQPMAAVLRSFIDERMAVPANAWTVNPMLVATPVDPAWEGHADGAVNHDHYVYGSPKQYAQAGGQWVPTPPDAEALSARAVAPSARRKARR